MTGFHAAWFYQGVNVLNVEEIERELRKLAAHAAYPQAARWLTTVARNYLVAHLGPQDQEVNFIVYDPTQKFPYPDMPSPRSLPDWAVSRLKAGETLYWFDPVQISRRKVWQTVAHILEWFNSFPNDDKRLNRLDRINFETAAYGAGRWMADVSANVWAYVKDKPPVVVRYENKFCWVRLQSQLHFEREGRLMNHCIGGYSYYRQCQSGEYAVYSLRDEFNTPHTTLLANALGVQQCKGNSNGKPARDYQPYILDLIRRQHWQVIGDRSYIDL